MTTEKTPAAWSAVTAQWAAWRAAYLAEVERFAETLRPRFASGELRAERSPEDDQERIPGTTGWGDECFTHDPTPEEVIERLVEEHFGIAVTKTPDAHGGVVFDGDASAAHLILAVSPHSEATEDHVDHPCYHASAAATWDVIAIARERGWYTPTHEECEDPLIGNTPCPDCGHLVCCHEEDGCHGQKCGCKRPHTPHVREEVAA